MTPIPQTIQEPLRFLPDPPKEEVEEPMEIVPSIPYGYEDTKDWSWR